MHKSKNTVGRKASCPNELVKTRAGFEQPQDQNECHHLPKYQIKLSYQQFKKKVNSCIHVGNEKSAIKCA